MEQINSDVTRRVGNNIRLFRKRFKYTQDELGEMVGISGATVSNYEKGIGVNMNTVNRIAVALGISENDLYFVERAAMLPDAVFKHKTTYTNKIRLGGNWYWAESETIYEEESNKWRVSEFRVTDMDTGDRIDANSDLSRRCRQMVIDMVHSQKAS